MPKSTGLPSVYIVDDLMVIDGLEVGCEVVLHRW